MSFQFREFPASYRYCQGGIAASMFSLTLLGLVFRQNVPPIVRTVLLALILTVMAGALLLSNYVIIKYPYLSLVEPEDGDPFTRHYASHGSCLYSVLKYVAIVTVAGILLGIVSSGIDTTPKIVSVIYLGMLLPFLVFLTLFYDPVRHPTISTFIRATLGIGIVLFPLFAITIAIGVFRCWYLLAGMDSQIEMNPVEIDYKTDL